MKELRDIYFTDRYCKIYEEKGDGNLEVFTFQTKNGKIIYKFLKREIDIIDGQKYFDITTPYGYGGPLIILLDREANREQVIEEFKKAFEKYCIENNIVSEFIRFHPIEKNYIGMEKYMDIEYIVIAPFCDYLNVK